MAIDYCIYLKLLIRTIHKCPNTIINYYWEFKYVFLLYEFISSFSLFNIWSNVAFICYKVLPFIGSGFIWMWFSYNYLRYFIIYYIFTYLNFFIFIPAFYPSAITPFDSANLFNYVSIDIKYLNSFKYTPLSYNSVSLYINKNLNIKRQWWMKNIAYLKVNLSLNT